jgi:hypothetical protein
MQLITICYTPKRSLWKPWSALLWPFSVVKDSMLVGPFHFFPSNYARELQFISLRRQKYKERGEVPFPNPKKNAYIQKCTTQNNKRPPTPTDPQLKKRFRWPGRVGLKSLLKDKIKKLAHVNWEIAQLVEPPGSIWDAANAGSNQGGAHRSWEYLAKGCTLLS